MSCKCGRIFCCGCGNCKRRSPLYNLPKIDPLIPKYEPINFLFHTKYEPIKLKQPKIGSYDDRSDWNRKYGYHHTLGPAFGPKFLP